MYKVNVSTMHSSKHIERSSVVSRACGGGSGSVEKGRAGEMV